MQQPVTSKGAPMKKVAGILVLLIVTAFSFGEIVDEDGYTKGIVEAKVKKFKNIRTTGLVMLGCGGALIASGIVCISNADWEPRPVSEDGDVNSSVGAGAAGITMTTLGVPVTIAGIVLTSIGSKKSKEYKLRLRLFSGYNPHNNEFRAGICYRF